MQRLIITESAADLTSHAGLGLVGMAVNRCADLAVQAAAVAPSRNESVPHVDFLASYVALLCLGKSDFEAIKGFRDDAYFAAALGLKRVPSEGILRQRLDTHAAPYKAVVEAAAIEFLRRVHA